MIRAVDTMPCSRVCRLCLGGGDTLADIFDENGKLSYVEGCIEDLLQFRVVKDLFIPWLICSKCLENLNAFRRFKFKCLECKIKFDSSFIQDDFEASNTERIPETKEEVEEENVEPVGSLDVNTNDNELTHSDELPNSDDMDVKPSFSTIPPQVDGASIGRSALQFKECIPPVVPTDKQDGTITSTNVRRSLRLQCSRDHHETNVCDPCIEDRVPTVGRDEETISRIVDAKALDAKKRARRQKSLGFDTLALWRKQRREGEGRSDDTLLPQGIEAEDVEMSNRNHTKKTLHKTASKASLKKDRRDWNREYNRRYYHSLSEEKKKRFLQCIIEAKKRRLSLMTEKERKQFNRRKNESGKRRYSLMTEEERKQISRRQKESRRRRLSLMTEEERKQFNRLRNEAQKKRYFLMTEEERKELNRRRNESKKRRLSLMTEEERKQFYSCRRETGKRRLCLMKEGEEGVL